MTVLEEVSTLTARYQTTIPDARIARQPASIVSYTEADAADDLALVKGVLRLPEVATLRQSHGWRIWFGELCNSASLVPLIVIFTAAEFPRRFAGKDAFVGNILFVIGTDHNLAKHAGHPAPTNL